MLVMVTEGGDLSSSDVPFFLKSQELVKKHSYFMLHFMHFHVD